MLVYAAEQEPWDVQATSLTVCVFGPGRRTPHSAKPEGEEQSEAVGEGEESGEWGVGGVCLSLT